MKNFSFKPMFSRLGAGLGHSPYEKTFVINNRIPNLASTSKASIKELLKDFFNSDMVIFGEDLGIKDGDISQKLNQLEPHSVVFLNPGHYQISNLQSIVRIVTPDAFWDYRDLIHWFYEFWFPLNENKRPFCGTYFEIGEISGQLITYGGIYDITEAEFPPYIPILFNNSSVILRGQSTQPDGAYVSVQDSILFILGETNSYDLRWCNLCRSKIVSSTYSLYLSDSEYSLFVYDLPDFSSPYNLYIEGVDSDDLILRTRNLTIDYYCCLNGELVLLFCDIWGLTLTFSDTYPIYISQIIAYDNLTINLLNYSEGYIGEIVSVYGDNLTINASPYTSLKIGKLKNVGSYQKFGSGEVIIED